MPSLRLRKIIIIFLFGLTAAPALVSAQFRYLIPYYEKGMYGYCDTNAVVKIKPHFTNADFFKLGYAFVDEGGGQINIIDTAGELLLPVSYPKLDFINRGYYSELVMAEDNEGKGYVYDLQNKKLLNHGLNALFGSRDLYVESSRYFTILGEIPATRGIYDVVTKKFIYTTTFTYMKMEEDNEVVSKIKGRYYFVLRENGNSNYTPDKISFVYLQNGKLSFYKKTPKKQKAVAATRQTVLEETKVSDGMAYSSAFGMPKIVPYKRGDQMGIIVNEIKNDRLIKTDSIKMFFDTIIFPCGTTDPSSCCLVKLHNQWGIWNWTQNLLSPVIYDTIKQNTETYCEYFFTVKNKKSGLYYHTRELLPAEYDKINSVNMSGFSLSKNNSFGYFKNLNFTDTAKGNTGLFIPCIFDLSISSEITVYPVNAKIKRDTLHLYSFDIEGPRYQILSHRTPDFKYRSNHKLLYVSTEGKKFYTIDLNSPAGNKQ